MKVGIPSEVREHEQRVAVTPETVKKIIGLGCEVVVEKGAGIGAQLFEVARP